MVEAQEFVKEEIVSLWDRWTPSQREVDMWADAFRLYSYSDALAGFQRYYASDDYTIQRPKIAVVLKHLWRTNGKIDTWFWVQNTRTGTFRPYYWAGNKEKVLYRLFQEEGAPLGDGAWKKYEQDEITHKELFEYRRRKQKGMEFAVKNLESEEEAAYIVEEYMVKPKSATAKAIKKAVAKLKTEQNKAQQKEAIKTLKKDEEMPVEVVEEFAEKYDLDESDIESMHPPEQPKQDDYDGDLF